MRRLVPLAAIALLAIATAPRAADGTTAASAPVRLDGSVDARVSRNVSDAASPPHGPAAAASAASEAAGSRNAKAEADADLAARQAGDKGRLKIDKENLQGSAAKKELQKGTLPSNYDHSISMGEKDHTEQVTNVRVYLDKPSR
jgi:hypothetical protein